MVVQVESLPQADEPAALTALTAQKPVRFQIPTDLRERQRWVNWCKNGNKKPCQPNIDEPQEWLSFSAALCRSDKVGFVLGDGIIGIDLDHVLDANGDVKPESVEIVNDALALKTYTEISPSGDGLHVLLFGTIEHDHNLDGREIYSRDRYFTVTGRRFKDAPRQLADAERCQELLTAFYHKWFPPKVQSPTYQASVSDASESNLSDGAILEKLFNEKRDGAKWSALWHQGWSQFNSFGYKSQSEADSAMVRKLRFYAGANAATIDTLFRASALMRPKWDELHGAKTYGQTTIDWAIAKGGKLYTPATASAKAAKRAKREAQGISIVPFWWITHTPPIGELAWRVLAILKSYADEDGTNAYPSQETIAAHLGLKSAGEVKTVIDRLVESHLVERHGSGMELTYTVTTKRPHVDVSPFARRFGEQRSSGRGSRTFGKGKVAHVDSAIPLTSTSGYQSRIPTPVINTGGECNAPQKFEKPAFEETT